MDIKSLIRVGSVSSVNPANGTARVALEVNDDNVTYELPVLTRGSKANKDYWIPDIDEQVVCLFLPNTSGRGVCQGFILGTFYSRTDAPVENSQDVQAIKFSDGTEIRHDRSSGDLTIHAAGNISIIADGDITVNGQMIYLN